MAARRTRQAIEATELTKFAAMLEEWGYQQRPIIKTRADLARRLRIAVNTVNNWFAKGQQPRAEYVWQVVHATGLDARETFAAAGYAEIPPDPNAELRGNIAERIFEKLRGCIDQEPLLSTQERAKFQGLLKKWWGDEQTAPGRAQLTAGSVAALPRARRVREHVEQN
jgi:transcriptional regulator with XRE-family HTH domain